MKLQLIYFLSWVSLNQAAYMSRMMVNRMRPGVASFRPGVMLQRPWVPHRPGQATSHRPYIVYRQHNPQNRYAVKQFSPTRSVYSAPWRASRPVSSTEREFIRAATTVAHNGGIHTIPAPNLSLKEKPIVVVDASSEKPKFFEVTEKYPDSSIFQLAKIEQPIGFSKTSSLPSQDLQSLVQNGAGFQLSLGAPDLGISSHSLQQPAQFQQNLPQPSQFQHTLQQPSQFQQSLQPSQFQQALQPYQFQQSLQPFQFQQAVQPTQFQQQLGQQSVVQPVVQQNPLLPQQFSVQRLNTINNSPEIVQARPEGIVISPSALYQPDPAFLQKLQNQLMQRFPGIEFVPYVAEFTAPIPSGGQKEKPVQSQTQGQLQAQESQIQIQTVAPESKPQTQNQPSQSQPTPPQPQPQSEQQTSVTPEEPLFLLQNEQITKQTPTSFALNEFQKNVVQRETPEATVTLIAVTSPVNNITENRVEITTVGQQHNFTSAPKIAEQGTTTVKYILESSTADPKTTPIYYAQVGQSIGNVIANGFYSAINDIRAAALQQDIAQNVTNPQENSAAINVSTSTINPDLQPYFVQKNVEKDAQNTTANEIQPLLGAPFKTQDSTVAYTLVRADDKENKISKDGSIYAGQLVEASVSEDQDFNKAKATFPKRAPLRLVARAESKESISNNTVPKVDVVKARIPPRSKLTFDDKTGEPVLRIYASYVNSPAQKEMLTSKLQSSKRVREAVYRKQDPVQAAARSRDSDSSQVTQFGLKLRSRSDDYMPLFDDYQD